MTKYCLLIGLSLILSSCSAPKDEQYYRDNPRELQYLAKACPAQNTSNLTCEQLTKLALDMNKLAFELQMEPQHFGHKILNLQNSIYLEQKSLAAVPNSAMQDALVKKQEELKQRLAIVKWLESPEG